MLCRHVWRTPVTANCNLPDTDAQSKKETSKFREFSLRTEITENSCLATMTNPHLATEFFGYEIFFHFLNQRKAFKVSWLKMLQVFFGPSLLGVGGKGRQIQKKMGALR